jgi:hypothetical protein
MRFWSKLATLALAVGLGYAPTHAAVVITEGANTSNIPGLTGFTTTGAMMDGLSVTATFASGFSQTLLWADIDADGGGVSGTGGWALRLDGDTFTAPWNFTGRTLATGAADPLNQLDLNGLNALTVFDRTFGGAEGTPGSASGNDFECTGAPDICLNPRIVRVLYDFRVNVGAAPAVGDLFQTVSITFCTGVEGPCTPNAVAGNWSFLQDTDNDSRILIVPEPTTLALLGIALAGLGFSRRRKAH